MSPRVHEVNVNLPHPALPDGDWADGFSVVVDQPFDNARSAGDAIIAAFPKWMSPALFLRKILVAPFGLKGAIHHNGSDRVGIFPITYEASDALYAGIDETHLNFRIVVEIEDHAGGQQVLLKTIIKRHNALGRYYLRLIMPFHRRIITSALAKLNETKLN
ncbi:DUF2867 domain-containing protein [Ahrensia kielensis]|uniref:DUF2867 domain-containing protein n=1 Tax=Ahrensia kielensis TaxID=76980 RepID=UPI00037816D6|nr:DUF2867 domain-containing protein [Ahrensia kielensis]